MKLKELSAHDKMTSKKQQQTEISRKDFTFYCSKKISESHLWCKTLNVILLLL